MNKYRHIFILLILTYLVIFSGCDDKNHIDPGYLKGTISIGPLCPVERIPPDPACLPSAETYKAYQVDVFSSDGVNIIAELKPSLDGNFKIELPTGIYKINLAKGIVNIGGSNLPSEVTIEKGDTTLVNINIDTGIR